MRLAQAHNTGNERTLVSIEAANCEATGSRQAEAVEKMWRCICRPVETSGKMCRQWFKCRQSDSALFRSEEEHQWPPPKKIAQLVKQHLKFYFGHCWKWLRTTWISVSQHERKCCREERGQAEMVTGDWLRPRWKGPAQSKGRRRALRRGPVFISLLPMRRSLSDGLSVCLKGRRPAVAIRPHPTRRCCRRRLLVVLSLLSDGGSADMHPQMNRIYCTRTVELLWTDLQLNSSTKGQENTETESLQHPEQQQQHPSTPVTVGAKGKKVQLLTGLYFSIPVFGWYFNFN